MVLLENVQTEVDLRVRNISALGLLRSGRPARPVGTLTAGFRGFAASFLNFPKVGKSNFGAKRSCVIIVENLPVPFDRRVWQEALALRDAGWQVSVICPVSECHPLETEEIEGIAIYRHALPVEARGKIGFFFEYSVALVQELRLLFKIWRERDFKIIQACNPPDLLFLVVLPFKLFGKKFLFDHHDINPELFEAKFGRRGLIYWLLVRLEKLTFMSADFVVSANETFRKIAISRGGKKPDDVIAVYSVPDKSRMRRVAPNGALRRGKRFVLGYVGVIGDQDGVDHMVEAIDYLVRVKKNTDLHAVVVGDGPALNSVRKVVKRLGLEDYVTFTGYLSGEALLSALSTFDIGIIPDPMNKYNDKISMNKVFEYGAFGIPSVSYGLTETRRLLGDAGIFAAGKSPDHLGEAVYRLMTDDGLRERCTVAAEAMNFCWEEEARKYVGAFERLLMAETR
jgi:glycosyltransferase involved in cell wall biosynthesis